MVENNGVGEEFQEHLQLICLYKSTLDRGDALDRVYHPDFDLQGAIEKNDPVLGWTALDSVCQVRPTEAQVEALGPEFKAKFDEHWGAHPGRCIGVNTAVTG